MTHSSQLSERLIQSQLKEAVETGVKHKIEVIKKEEIMKQMQIRYTKYYRHWKDFDLLTCILATIGLMLAVFDYEQEYDYYGDYSDQDDSMVRMVVSIVTLLAVISLLFRYWLYTFWMDFKSSKQFFLRLMELQKVANEGVNPEAEIDVSQTEESSFWRFLQQIWSFQFLFEFVILVIHPYNGSDSNYTFTFESVDMLGSKDDMIAVNYRVSDFLLAFMFLRSYFLIRTLLNFTVYSDLYSKKVCAKYGFEGDTSFQIKALYIKQTGTFIIFVATFSLLILSYVVRIFERIFYNASGLIVFDSYFTAIWNVIITMTTVGYGDVYACSPFGRIISIMNALWGAFVISLLMGSIGTIFDLNNSEKRAVAEITNSKQAAVSIRTSVQFFNAAVDSRKNRDLPPEERNDYVYTREEVREFKNIVTNEVDTMRAERKQNDELLPKANPAEGHVKVVKNQILDLNDKIDYLVFIMMRDQMLSQQEGEFNMAGSAADKSESEYKKDVKKFQKAANLNSLIDSQAMKHPPPKPTLQQRLNTIRKTHTKLMTGEEEKEE